MTDLSSCTLPQLQQLLDSWGEPRFRAKQVYSWLHQKRACSFEEMTDLPRTLREKLQQNARITTLKIRRKLVSAIDGTIKYLFELPDGETVETVFMHYRHGDSICISSQVGCKMGCRFCASTLAGYVRDLTPSELLGQIYETERDSGRKVDSVVLMGIGEPLDNYDNVLQFLHMLSDPNGKNLSLRHVSLSTCGLVPRIDALAAEKLQLTLSISLHAPNSALRSRTMPINDVYDIDALIAACRRYFEATGRRVSFEYALIEGENDSVACAHELARLLSGMNCHVNLIPVNPVKERGYIRSSRQRIEQFVKTLESHGIVSTVRRELGADINAACGQLRREDKKEAMGGC